jgi:hypothetical protein
LIARATPSGVERIFFALSPPSARIESGRSVVRLVLDAV